MKSVNPDLEDLRARGEGRASSSVVDLEPEGSGHSVRDHAILARGEAPHLEGNHFLEGNDDLGADGIGRSRREDAEVELVSIARRLDGVDFRAPVGELAMDDGASLDGEGLEDPDAHFGDPGFLDDPGRIGALLASREEQERKRDCDADAIHGVYNSAMRRLLPLFILVPVLELVLLIEIGRRLGTAPTLLLLLFTGSLGAFVARRQGLGALRAAQEQMQRGELPAGPIADGILILVAAALLIAPGVLTDAFGFLLLVGSVRDRIKSLVVKEFRRGIEERRIRVYASGFERAPFDAEACPVDIGETPPHRIH